MQAGSPIVANCRYQYSSSAGCNVACPYEYSLYVVSMEAYRGKMPGSVPRMQIECVVILVNLNFNVV